MGFNPRKKSRRYARRVATIEWRQISIVATRRVLGCEILHCPATSGIDSPAPHRKMPYVPALKLPSEKNEQKPDSVVLSLQERN